MRRLLTITVLTLAACTPSGTNDTFTIPDPPDGLSLTAVDEYELTDQTFESTDDDTLTPEEFRLHQATNGDSMSLGGGTRQTFGADQGSAAAWNDIDNLADERGFVLTTFPTSGDHGIELVQQVRSAQGVSAAQFTDPSGTFTTAAGSRQQPDASHFLAWQQNGSWIVLYSDTIPVLELTFLARTIEPARLPDL